MFVVSIKRFTVLAGLTSAWVLLLVYSFFGFLFWVGFIALGFIKPYASSLYSSMHKNLDITVNGIWPPAVFVGSVIVLVVFWFFSVRLLFSYGDRKRILVRINNAIADIPSLSTPGGFVSYTLRGMHGSITTEVVCIGDGDYELKTTRRDAVGTPINRITIFGASSDFFSSDDGFSEVEMDNILGILLVEKEYGVQSRQIENSY